MLGTILGISALFVLVAMVLCWAYRQRFTSTKTQANTLARRFDGRGSVYFHPAMWTLDAATARDIAWRHGYVQRQPQYRSVERQIGVPPERGWLHFVPTGRQHPPE